MSYGSSAYGAIAYSGSAGSDWQVFFPLIFRDTGTVYEASVSFSGSNSFYEVRTRQETEEINVVYRIYSAHEAGETPQLQVTAGGGGPTQSIIAAAPLITVQAEVVDDEFGNIFSVTGRGYNQ